MTAVSLMGALVTTRSRLHAVEKKPLMSRRSKVHLKVVGVLLKVQKLLSRMVILISNVGNYCKNVELCWWNGTLSDTRHAKVLKTKA